MARIVLILGASGRFGRNAALQFVQAGWAVRRFDRRRDDLSAAAQGADVIVNAWNPPYPEWQRLVPALHAKVRAVAAETGATVIVPGNVYVFGAETPDPWSEASPHAAQNRLGRIRIAMEAAYRRDAIRTIVLRAGDFIDTRASGNWFDRVMTKNLDRGVFAYPGNPDIDHAWAYLPDLCRAAVRLAEIRERLPAFTDIPFAGYTLGGAAMAAALDRVVPQNVRLRRMAWWPLYLARPVWPMARCLVEMRYLWDVPHRLDGALFRRLLPDFRPTPVLEALAGAVAASSAGVKIDPDQPMPAGG